MQAFYLQTQNMTVGYDKPLIEHIDLRLRRGEIMTLIGPNGAGKSTILKTIVLPAAPSWAAWWSWTARAWRA